MSALRRRGGRARCRGWTVRGPRRAARDRRRGGRAGRGGEPRARAPGQEGLRLLGRLAAGDLGVRTEGGAGASRMAVAAAATARALHAALLDPGAAEARPGEDLALRRTRRAALRA